MAKNKKTNNWLNKHIKDRYVLESKKMNFSSRAAFKLLSIDKKYQILNKVKYVVDLGCAPGSWCEVLSKKSEIKNIIGIDKLPCGPIKNVEIHQIDINDYSKIKEVMSKYNYKFDLVLSDIAPNITGVTTIDQENFMVVAESILEFCKVYLNYGGKMVMKFFNGYKLSELKESLTDVFDEVSIYKPDSSRQKSREVYLVCVDYRHQ